jgi:hypothetical protein
MAEHATAFAQLLPFWFTGCMASSASAEGTMLPYLGVFGKLRPEAEGGESPEEVVDAEFGVGGGVPVSKALPSVAGAVDARNAACGLGGLDMEMLLLVVWGV